MLNWSIGVIVGFIGFIPAFFAFTITVIQYFKDKYDHLRYLAGMWFFLSIWILFQGISDLFLSIELHFVCFYALIAFSFFGNLAVDTLTRDSVDLLKMIITTIISCFVIYFSYITFLISGEGFVTVSLLKSIFFRLIFSLKILIIIHLQKI